MTTRTFLAALSLASLPLVSAAADEHALVLPPHAVGPAARQAPEIVEVVGTNPDHWFTRQQWDRAHASGLSRPYTAAEQDEIRRGNFAYVQVGNRGPWRMPRIDLGPAHHRGVSVALPRAGAQALVKR